MSDSEKPSGDDWGGPEETPWQQPGEQPQQPPQQPPQYGGGQQPPYGQQPPQYGGGQPPYGGGQPPYGGGQPPYGGPPPGQKLPNYLVHNILTTVFCCLPLGIVGIVFASQVNGKQNAGDFAGAKKASDQARLFFIISLVAGIVVGIIWIAYYASVDTY